MPLINYGCRKPNEEVLVADEVGKKNHPAGNYAKRLLHDGLSPSTA